VVWQLDPGGSRYLKVTFAPTKAGSFKHQLVIDTTAAR
jgi:hypothetical protein